MEHIAALLLIIGCSNDLAQCKELPAPVPVYETVEECQGDLPIAIRIVTGTAQKIMAQCVEVDPALEEEDAELVWDINPDGTLSASVEVPQVVVASEAHRRDKDNARQE